MAGTSYDLANLVVENHENPYVPQHGQSLEQAAVRDAVGGILVQIMSQHSQARGWYGQLGISNRWVHCLTCHGSRCPSPQGAFKSPPWIINGHDHLVVHHFVFHDMQAAVRDAIGGVLVQTMRQNSQTRALSHWDAVPDCQNDCPEQEHQC